MEGPGPPCLAMVLADPARAVNSCFRRPKSVQFETFAPDGAVTAAGLIVISDT